MKVFAMTFNVVDTFSTVLERLFEFIDMDYKFMCDMPESSLNSTEKYNILIGITGDYEGNIMFCFSQKVAEDIAKNIMGVDKISTIDIFVKAALADFFNEAVKRFANLAKITNMNEENNPKKDYTILTSNPAYISGQDLYMISKVPSRKIFFKINGEKFGLAYSMAKK
ncbi:MAG: chemotaxis protein CheX [Candidatus Gastranaerophilales bacterium]|nr:chemotaxis protein CheX [Candidatus Gastranaerophilales bacterium]